MTAVGTIGCEVCLSGYREMLRLACGSFQIVAVYAAYLPLTRLPLPPRGGRRSRDDGFLLAREVAIRPTQAAVARRAFGFGVVC